MKKKYLVTGGGGFLGKALCKRLAAPGVEVFSVARGEYPELRELGVNHHRIDLCFEKSKLHDVMRNSDAVFHVAAKVDMWGSYKSFFKANVIATRNVIEACRENSVPNLVFTSSPSVVADGRDLLGIDESYPYPERYLAFYPETKAIAEKEVLAANGDRLATIALRPHLIWGPGDTNLVPTILSKAKAGKLMRVGSGDNMTDLTFIEDCVDAHLLALEALRNKSTSGKAYFISQGRPVNMWDWIDQVLQLKGLPKVKKRISYPLARKVAAICEAGAKLFPVLGEPLLTRFLVCEMATSHYFNIAAARKDLGFEPKYSIEEAMNLTFKEG